MKKNTDNNLIQKCINISCYGKDDLNNNSFIFSWKTSLASFKDDLKYNLFKFNSKFEMPNSIVHIFNKEYKSSNEQEAQKYNRKISKIIYVSYRSKYKPQTNIKNNKIFTSDCGWGCMIRSSQMILCRALYKIFKYDYKLEGDIVKHIIPFIMDKNLNIVNNNYLGMDSYITKLKELSKKDIVEIDPPFSIHKIVILGEKFGRTSGEWFSDFELPKIYDMINTTFDIVPNLSIIHFNSFIEVKTILERCFKEIDSNKESNILKDDNKNKIFEIEGKKYLMEKMGLLFVSVRLGLDNVAPDYFPSIKNLFTCKECLGFIGGKKWTNSASYFFGYYENNLLFLDPHFNHQSIDNLDNNNISTYINKVIYKLDIKTLKAGFTIGFLFRNMKEFNELIEFLRVYKEEENPCFSFSDKLKKVEDEFIESDINQISEQNDF